MENENQDNEVPIENDGNPNNLLINNENNQGFANELNGLWENENNILFNKQIKNIAMFGFPSLLFVSN